MNEKVVIVGAGQAGCQVAISLRMGGYQGRITLLGKESWLPYQRPPLSKQVLKGDWPADKCLLRQQDYFDSGEIDFRPDSAVQRLDKERQEIILEGGESHQYDHLVICTGSRLNRLALPGPQLSGLHYLRTIDDALNLRKAISAGSRLAVIGAGYIGLEVAASARSMGCEVDVIEAAPGIMQRTALPQVAEHLLDRHQREGVRFHLNTRVAEVAGNKSVESITLESGEEIRVDAILRGIGVRPELRWLEGSGIEVRRGVRVDQHGRTNVKNILAAGDCAETDHPLYEEPVVLESVQNAVDQAKIAASTILGGSTVYENAPWFWSEQYDCRLQMAGLPGLNDEVVVRKTPEGILSVLSVGSSGLNAIQCINHPRDYMSGRKLIAYRGQLDRDLLLDPSADLKALIGKLS